MTTLNERRLAGFRGFFCAFLLIFVTGSISYGGPAVKDRIVLPVNNQEVSIIRGTVHPLAQPRYDQGRANGSMKLSPITMMFRPSQSQQASLKTLLEQLQTPGSPEYHKWLTPEEFGSRFGLGQNDLNKIVSWLGGQGFAVDRVARSHMWVVFSGTASEVDSAFHTEIHQYVMNGKSHYANATDPSVPSAFANVVLGFQELNNFRAKPRAVIRHVASNPHFTSSISGNHFLTPNDFATIYDVTALYNGGLDGTGEKIAVAGQTDIQMSDIEAFRTASGLPANDPTVLPTSSYSGPGISSNDIGEADLDLEWAGAVAPNATIVYVNDGKLGDVFNAFKYAIDQDVAPVLVITYGNCEAQWGASGLSTLETQAQQANAEGMTIISPSGDDGAADCDAPVNSTTVVKSATQGPAVDAPASLPEVTGIGGTEFAEGTGTYWSATNNTQNGSALSYIPETAWNDTDSTNGLFATGGGASIYFSKPVWQTGNGVPNDGARDVPDVALAASPNHDGYLVCSQGSCVNGFRDSNQNLDVVGGTSAGAPAFAGILSLIIQETNIPQGNINYILYPLNPLAPDAFHDITTGNNIVPCTAGSTGCPSSGSFGFNAGPGYDQVTGLGTLDAYNLAADWTEVSSTSGTKPDFQLAISPGVLTLATTGSGQVTINVKAINGFTGAINLACTVPLALTGTTCSVTPASLSASGAATLTVNFTQAMIPLGNTGLGGWPAAALACAILLAVSAFCLARSRSFTRPGWRLRWAFAAALLLVCFAMSNASCGGGGSSNSVGTTPPPSQVTANVTVQASSGTLSHSVQLAVTEN